MSDNRDHGTISAILEAIQHIRDYTSSISNAEDFYRNTMVFDATLMNFVVVGEMSRRISDQLRDRHSEIPWQKTKSFRNLVAHDYLGIDAEEVWQIVTGDIPALEQQILSIKDEFERQESEDS
ncbi:MAG: DUF86 domain-containing protein [Spirochaetia bacterium]